MSCGVGHGCSSDPVLLWLWCRPAATALIWPLAWEPPYAAKAAQEMAKTKKKKIYIHWCSHLTLGNLSEGNKENIKYIMIFKIVLLIKKKNLKTAWVSKDNCQANCEEVIQSLKKLWRKLCKTREKPDMLVKSTWNSICNDEYIKTIYAQEKAQKNKI